MNLFNEQERDCLSKFTACLKTLTNHHANKNGIDVIALAIDLRSICEEYMANNRLHIVNDLMLLSIGYIHNLRMLGGAVKAEEKGGIELYDKVTDFELFTIGIVLSGKSQDDIKKRFNKLKGADNDQES